MFIYEKLYTLALTNHTQTRCVSFKNRTMNNQINELLLKDIYVRLSKMIDDGISIDKHELINHIEKLDTFSFLFDNHNDYFETSLLSQKSDLIPGLNKMILKYHNGNYNYDNKINYSLVDFHIENNGYLLLLSILMEILSTKQL